MSLSKAKATAASAAASAATREQAVGHAAERRDHHGPRPLATVDNRHQPVDRGRIRHRAAAELHHAHLTPLLKEKTRRK